MDERNVIGGITAATLSGVISFLEPLRWFFVLGLILVLTDLRFGISAARMRQEKVRTSRAIRRTINKIIDYLCWIFTAGTIGAAFGGPFSITTLPALVMLVVYGIEINSCFANYFEARGKKVKVNIFKYFSKNNDIIEVEEIEKKEEAK